ncbi:hypothetical protein Cadr_000007868 [Camelus dromedarius]|uniref:Uncharacterized protein n=1 Tax=Camelus dromedarius TaxID=9838 RepID=A0A5N4DYM8_CAMDR|nr:hypothetical protein Cadr_000007868 [Camelus dromedarius]
MAVGRVSSASEGLLWGRVVRERGWRSQGAKRGRRAWVRLCCPLNDTQSCGPAAEESCGGAGGGGGSLSEQGGWRDGGEDEGGRDWGRDAGGHSCVVRLISMVAAVAAAGSALVCVRGGQGRRELGEGEGGARRVRSRFATVSAPSLRSLTRLGPPGSLREEAGAGKEGSRGPAAASLARTVLQLPSGRATLWAAALPGPGRSRNSGTRTSARPSVRYSGSSAASLGLGLWDPLVAHSPEKAWALRAVGRRRSSKIRQALSPHVSVKLLEKYRLLFLSTGRGSSVPASGADPATACGQDGNSDERHGCLVKGDSRHRGERASLYLGLWGGGGAGGGRAEQPPRRTGQFHAGTAARPRGTPSPRAPSEPGCYLGRNPKLTWPNSAHWLATRLLPLQQDWGARMQDGRWFSRRHWFRVRR